MDNQEARYMDKIDRNRNTNSILNDDLQSVDYTYATGCRDNDGGDE